MHVSSVETTMLTLIMFMLKLMDLKSGSQKFVSGTGQKKEKKNTITLYMYLELEREMFWSFFT